MTSILPVIAGLVSGIALIILFIIWSNQPAGTGNFISQAEAINAVTERYPFLRNDNLEPKFGYVKYRGVGTGVDGNSEHKVDWYAADHASGEIQNLLHPEIGVNMAGRSFSGNAYVWTISYFVPASSRFVFVNADDGEIIGEWVQCPRCICYHGGISYK